MTIAVSFAVINVVLGIAWFLMARRIGQEYKALSASQQPPAMSA